MAKFVTILFALILLFSSNLFAQNIEEEINRLLISMDKEPEAIEISETNNGYVIEIIYLNSVKDIREAEDMYYDSIVRNIRSTMGTIYYSLYIAQRNILHIVSITAKDSQGKNILSTSFRDNPNNRINWQALEHIAKRAIADRWQTSFYSHKNKVWFDVPESVMTNRFYN